MRAGRILLLFSLLLLLPLPAAAVTLTVGNEIPTPSSSDGNVGATRTDIDLVHPASHWGTVTTVKVYWSSSCTNALKIKFFRRVGETLTMTAQRGPFNAASGLNTLTLSPAVTVEQGDLIGVARVAACGNAGAMVGFPSEGYLQYAGDVTGSVSIASAVIRQGGVLSVYGSGIVTGWTARVIPVVGSLPGAFDSRFKTEMQFFNAQSAIPINMKLIFHPVGVAGSTGDTTRLLNLDPYEIYSTADIVAAMGQTGLGSLDIVMAPGQTPPMILTRVYNDAGALGTSSLTELPVAVTDGVEIGTTLLARGVTGFLIAPRNPAATRFNIGVRTLWSGAVIQVTVRDDDGVVLRTITHTFTATYFVQFDSTTFCGIPLTGDETIQITVSSGSAIVYGSTTDNITNDPAVQFAYGLFGIA